MRLINEIIVHCAYTKPNMDIGAEWIRKIHVDQNGWSDIGYHFVIRRDGTIENGRPIERIGAHCKGHNSNTIGICLVGGMNGAGKPEDNFNQVQFEQLKLLIRKLVKTYPAIVKISGHRDYANKACPCFNVQDKI